MAREKEDKLLNEIVKNNVALQKTSLELIEAVGKLNDRIDRMLGLFEEAGKKIEEAQSLEEGPLKEKLEALLEQNKVIARGLVLLEKFIREKTSAGMAAATGYVQSSFEPKKLEKTV